ncbi:MAG: hypothetical protein ACYTDY_01965 [Planctomycetota bacterium]|jgi:hypothetical protein
MFLEQQQFWLGLVNSASAWRSEHELEEYVPEQNRDFSDPPGWTLDRTYTFLMNNVDLIRANHKALEGGKRLDYDLLNNILSEGTLRLVDWGDMEGIRAQQRSRDRVGSRIETLVAVSRKDGLNRGSVFVRNTVERALFYFSQYVDYRFSDTSYPDASPGKFQIKECLCSGCRKLFIRTPETLLYCSDDCARADR